MRSTVISIVAAALFAVPSLAQAATWQIDPSHTSVTFKVKHMMVSWVRGELSGVSGTMTYDPARPSQTTVDAEIDVNTVNTRDEKRDGHLKSPDFFDAAKHPKMTFKSVKVRSAAKGKMKIDGDLTLRGVTKRVTFDVTGISGEVADPWGNVKMGATATTTINRQEFGIKFNKTLDKGGVMVGNEVKITIDVELNKQVAKKS